MKMEGFHMTSVDHLYEVTSDKYNLVNGELIYSRSDNKLYVYRDNEFLQLTSDERHSDSIREVSEDNSLFLNSYKKKKLFYDRDKK